MSPPLRGDASWRWLEPRKYQAEAWYFRGSGTWIRTMVHGFKGRCPAVRRSRSSYLANPITRRFYTNFVIDASQKPCYSTPVLSTLSAAPTKRSADEASELAVVAQW